MAERAGAQAGWRVGVAGDARRLAPEAEALAFGAGCEAIDNARRHANARNVSIDVKVEQGWLTLEIGDDGVGFVLGRGCSESTPRTPSGLELAAQRLHNGGGRLVVDSAPGKGTRVAVWLPV
jgi:signal transduction histidine kinase